MINVVRIPITDRNIQCMLYVPSRREPTLFVPTTLATRLLKSFTPQVALMRLINETWEHSDHYPDTLAIRIDPNPHSSDPQYQLKLHALSDVDKLVVCLKTSSDYGSIKKELIALYDGDHKVLADYMRRLNVPYTLTPIEVVHPADEHLIPITHTKSELEDRLKVTKRKLHTSLVNNLNSSDIEPNTEYDLDEHSDMVLKIAGIPMRVTLSGELAISDDTCAVVINTSHQEVTRVHLGPTLLKEYLDHMTALAQLASYNERVRCNL